VASLAAAGVLALPRSAPAAVDGSDAGGSVTVGASDGGSTNGAPGGSTGDGAGGAGSPWLCVSTSLTLNDGPGFAPGGPTPGGWYSVTCTDQSTGATTTQTEWIANGSPTVTAGVDPSAVARRAENSLRLPTPVTNFNPSVLSVVNLATWLWIDADIWHPYSVTASVGSVSATAVATPSFVTWSTGDGGVVTCDGPGTPFDPAQTAAQQSTQCSHTYTVSSAGQPSPDVNGNDDAFVVVATIHWSVSWSATGDVGGGALPSLSTSTSSTVRVEQVESVNSGPTDASVGNPRTGGSPA
jgi:hypothetical protein